MCAAPLFLRLNTISGIEGDRELKTYDGVRLLRLVGVGGEVAQQLLQVFGRNSLSVHRLRRPSSAHHCGGPRGPEKTPSRGRGAAGEASRFSAQEAEPIAKGRRGARAQSSATDTLGFCRRKQTQMDLLRTSGARPT
jgi:hypothetical protein